MHSAHRPLEVEVIIFYFSAIICAAIVITMHICIICLIWIMGLYYNYII